RRPFPRPPAVSGHAHDRGGGAGGGPAGPGAARFPAHAGADRRREGAHAGDGEAGRRACGGKPARARRRRLRGGGRAPRERGPQGRRGRGPSRHDSVSLRGAAGRGAQVRRGGGAGLTLRARTAPAGTRTGMAREVWITGYGLLSPLGETSAAWFEVLATPERWRGAADAAAWAPFLVHPVRDYALEKQVAKPGDQRAMGPLMQYGAYAAGLALEMAKLKGDAALLQETHLVAASGAGERDWDLDKQILAKLDAVNDRG